MKFLISFSLFISLKAFAVTPVVTELAVGVENACAIVDGRVQVLGSIREGSQLRRILVAAWPGEGRHVVATASVPSGRWDTLAPKLADSFSTMRVEPLVAGRPPQRYLWAFLAMIAAMFFISVGLWRRRQSLRGDIDGR